MIAKGDTITQHSTLNTPHSGNADGPDIADLAFQLFIGPGLSGIGPAVGVVDGEGFSIPARQHDVMTGGGKISLAHGEDHRISHFQGIHHLFLYQRQFRCGKTQFSCALADESPGRTVASGLISVLFRKFCHRQGVHIFLAG